MKSAFKSINCEFKMMSFALKMMILMEMSRARGARELGTLCVFMYK